MIKYNYHTSGLSDACLYKAGDYNILPVWGVYG